MSARDFLTQQQQQALDLFGEITAMGEDQDLCVQILQNHRWNVDEAVNSFMGVGLQQENDDDDEGEVEFLAGAPSSIHRRTNSNSSSSNSSSSNSSSSNSSSSRVPLPRSAAAANPVNTGSNNATALDTMLGPLKWLFHVCPPRINPLQDARNFIQEFDSTYSPSHPHFCDTSYQAAVQRAHQEGKYLVVYLHSPLHEDTPKFCRQVLCTRNVTMVLNEHAVVWVGKVFDPEAYDLSTQLRVSSFPFVAVLLCPSAREVNVVDRVQGYMDEREFTERIESTVSANSNALGAMRQAVARREESSQLRAQQDREFREMEDSTRREAERRAREARERATLEEEERRLAASAAAQEATRQQERESAIKKKKDSLREPDNGPNVATIRFQLPMGVKISRRFERGDTVQTLCDFLDVHFAESGGSTTRFAVSTHFPKVDLTDMTATLDKLVSGSREDDARLLPLFHSSSPLTSPHPPLPLSSPTQGLHPRGMLYVQDLDA